MSVIPDLANVQSIHEGKALVYMPPSVFYNPVQEFNRDLTIAVIRNVVREQTVSADHCSLNEETSPEITEANNLDANVSATVIKSAGGSFEDCAVTVSPSSINNSSEVTKKSVSKRGFRILEGLAASGLRSVRFALEIPNVTEIVANDYDRTAVQYIQVNAEKNGVANRVTVSCADAAMLMYANRREPNRFDVIDLDPYGSPSPFLDAAVQSVADGGVLCITCTDMAVLCGNAAETCLAKYGAVSLRAPFCHEMALRILLQSIASHAARYQRFIEPLLSLSVDFYVRVFIRVRYGQSQVKELGTKLSNVYHCRQCGAFSLQPLMSKTKSMYVAGSGPPVSQKCDICGGRHIIAGPLWSAPIHNFSFVSQVLDAVMTDKDAFKSTRDRIIGMLTVVLEEIPDQPLYYVGDELCAVLHCMSPGFLPIRSALLHAGYAVSLSHSKKNSIKTNAPIGVLWDILRCWVHLHPVNSKRLQEGSIASVILSKQPAFEANFAFHPNANPKSRTSGLVRWQMNPDKDWGPKPRASRSVITSSVGDRRMKGEMKARMMRQKRKAEVI